MAVIVYLVRHSWFVFCFFFIYIVLLLPLIVVNNASCLPEILDCTFEWGLRTPILVRGRPYGVGDGTVRKSLCEFL